MNLKRCVVKVKLYKGKGTKVKWNGKHFNCWKEVFESLAIYFNRVHLKFLMGEDVEDVKK